MWTNSSKTHWFWAVQGAKRLGTDLAECRKNAHFSSELKKWSLTVRSFHSREGRKNFWKGLLFNLCVCMGLHAQGAEENTRSSETGVTASRVPPDMGSGNLHLELLIPLWINIRRASGKWIEETVTVTTDYCDVTWYIQYCFSVSLQHIRNPFHWSPATPVTSLEKTLVLLRIIHCCLLANLFWLFVLLSEIFLSEIWIGLHGHLKSSLLKGNK